MIVLCGSCGRLSLDPCVREDIKQQLFFSAYHNLKKVGYIQGTLPGTFLHQNTNFVASQGEYYWVNALPPRQWS